MKDKIAVAEAKTLLKRAGEIALSQFDVVGRGGYFDVHDVVRCRAVGDELGGDVWELGDATSALHAAVQMFAGMASEIEPIGKCTGVHAGSVRLIGTGRHQCARKNPRLLVDGAAEFHRVVALWFAIGAARNAVGLRDTGETATTPKESG